MVNSQKRLCRLTPNIVRCFPADHDHITYAPYKINISLSDRNYNKIVIKYTFFEEIRIVSRKFLHNSRVHCNCENMYRNNVTKEFAFVKRYFF